jgi:hypothetical protein
MQNTAPPQQKHGICKFVRLIDARREEVAYLTMSDAELYAAVDRALMVPPVGEHVKVLAKLHRYCKLRGRDTKPVAKRDLDWELWMDMVEEPAKYGEDIVEWLALDEKISKGPFAERRDAYWRQAQVDVNKAAVADILLKIAVQVDALKAKSKAQRPKAAVTIQRVVRGHRARNAIRHRDCCMCLAHVTSPIRTEVGMMCRACSEQGPYVDTTGPVSDPWNWYRA